MLSPSPSLARSISTEEPEKPAYNKVFMRRCSVRPLILVNGRAPRVPRRCGAPLHHIALARKPSLNASGLLLWARATS